MESAIALAAVLKDAAAKSRSISVAGNNSKRLMAGPCLEAATTISTTRLNRVLQYEPNDLTVSVEAGMRWATLQKLLAGHRQMVALDPPFAADSTAGGVLAANSSGPMRKAFGTARDLVIGMEFATVDGKLVRTGGMVVKNVAGIDMGKLMIGSFGTLAVITSVNFRLHTLPEETSTFVYQYKDLASAMEKRDALQASFLRPLAMDCLTPAAAARTDCGGYVLAVRAGGSKQVIERYARELSDGERISGRTEETFWEKIREFPAEFLRRQPEGVVLRISTALGEVGKLLRLVSGVAVARAGSGVCYAYLTSWHAAPALWQAAVENGWALSVEYAPEEVRRRQDLWLPPKAQNENSFAMMKEIKHMFDPGNLLNRSRLYGRI